MKGIPDCNCGSSVGKDTSYGKYQICCLNHSTCDRKTARYNTEIAAVEEWIKMQHYLDEYKPQPDCPKCGGSRLDELLGLCFACDYPHDFKCGNCASFGEQIATLANRLPIHDCIHSEGRYQTRINKSACAAFKPKGER